MSSTTTTTVVAKQDSPSSSSSPWADYDVELVHVGSSKNYFHDARGPGRPLSHTSSLRSFDTHDSYISMAEALRVGPASPSPSSLENKDVTTTPASLSSSEAPDSELAAAGRVGNKILSKKWATVVVAQLCTVTAMSSLINGLVTVSIPAMAADLQLSESLIFWPLMAYTLTNGSFQILAGAVADVLGNRRMNLLGAVLTGIFILTCGFARTGLELIIFRALHGIGVAIYFPTTLSILSLNLPSGPVRNIGISCWGFAQVIGFSIGLVMGGVLVSSVGWRVGFWLCGGITLALAIVGFWVVPKDSPSRNIAPASGPAAAQTSLPPPANRSKWNRVLHDVDWIGALLATACVGILAYALGSIANNTSSVKEPATIVLIVFSVSLMPAFALWARRQEKLSRPALIPNSLWRNVPFSSICAIVLLSMAVMQTMELLSSLYFQQVQSLSALQASLRILPSLVVGAILEIGTGVLIDRVPALYCVPIASLLGAGSPLLMAFVNPHWPYWQDAFISQLLEPLTVDILFTVGILVISQEFTDDTQALAGAVFNTVGQMGQSFGLALIAVISNTVSESQTKYPKDSPEGLLVGYKAGFWASFAWMIAAGLIGIWGLRKVGKVGLKRE